MTTPIDPKQVEALGPAERIIQTTLTHADHLYHGRPGIVVPAPHLPVGVVWEAATYKVEGTEKIAYFCRKVGKKTQRVRCGVIGADGVIRENGRVVGTYRQPGLFPEVAAWIYRQIAAVYALDNEFVARWASHAFGEDHRDLKVALAAFLLVQPRQGDPVIEDGKVLFHDADYRDVGEAMCLVRRAGKDLNPKLLLRIEEFLRLPAIAAINRELGFARSAKNPARGRWDKTITRWLTHREQNPKLLDGLVQAGFRSSVMALAQRTRFKPETPVFFRSLRWKQSQAADGRRTIAIGEAVAAAENWEGLSETQICQRIVATRPSYKRLVGLVPSSVGITRAIMTAAIESGAMSDQDLIIATPTLEDLGLLAVEPVKSRWEAALAKAQNQRAANIATRVKNTTTVEKLQGAVDVAITKAVEEVVKGLRIYVIVDISASMGTAIEQAKANVTQFLGGFPLAQLHVAVFNSAGREITIPHASRAGVDAAFKGITAGGCTDYGAGVRALQRHKPKADEDALFIFVGDEDAPAFTNAVQASGLNPVAFGLLKVGGLRRDAVSRTARELGIPCFNIDQAIFTDPYAIPRTIRNLIAATPVGQAPVARSTPRFSLIETILKTDLLSKPAWAEVPA